MDRLTKLYQIADISVCNRLHTMADRRDLIDIYSDLQDFYKESKLLQDTYYILPEQLDKAVSLGAITNEQQSKIEKLLLREVYNEHDFMNMLIEVNPVTDYVNIVTKYAWVEDYSRKIVDAITDGCKFSNYLLVDYCSD